MESKNERISLRVTTKEKNHLKRMADLADKSVSEYICDIAFSTTFGTAEKKTVEELQQLKEKILQQEADMRYLKKSVYVMTKLLLPLASEQAILRMLFLTPPEERYQERLTLEKKTQEKILSFYKECINDAEKKFDVEKNNKE